jgi:hypothetical protein
MEKFKLLRGRTILIDVPEKKESSIQLSAQDEDYIMKEAMKLWTALNVYAVGKNVEDVVEGDKVYVRTGALETAEKLEVEGKIKLVVTEGDIIIVW